MKDDYRQTMKTVHKLETLLKLAQEFNVRIDEVQV